MRNRRSGSTEARRLLELFAAWHVSESRFDVTFRRDAAILRSRRPRTLAATMG
jgi:hypothetical protein